VVSVLLAPVVISLLMLGAHFLRAGNAVLVGLVAVALALLGVRRRWAAWLVQVALMLGTVEWVRTLVTLAAQRSAAGQTFTRLVAILACVTLVTALSALVFRTARLRRWFDQGG
jgi:hypothetical protein